MTRTQKDTRIGVLIMAYGGPESLDDIPGYLADIRSGRVTTPAVLRAIRRNYEHIGGKSPLLGITRQVVAEIASRLDDTRFACYLGMRHWSPWIEDTIRDMIDDGIERAVSIVMAPHFSTLSVDRYHAKIDSGLEMYRGDIEFEHVSSYHDAPGLIKALASRVQSGLASWPDDEAAHVVFSAHSLPTRIVDAGDPYVDQLLETANLVAGEAGLSEDQWSWSYQSAGRSPEPWLGPQLTEHLETLAERGVSRVVSVPVGFISDHVEILYDIDIEAQKKANELGIALVRPPALNTEPEFMDELANLITSAAASKEW